ncbi:hypothetical protein OUZ56_033016 [Daphnia magna]|uniref:Uncharacterized protein n=1 Tax=Daphnia magna TaxID=35525 RepID=A0ABR0BA00_9CRUS|nr:hypothetical protein OUZ56_033016 [Daphnia magna]
MFSDVRISKPLKVLFISLKRSLKPFGYALQVYEFSVAWGHIDNLRQLKERDVGVSTLTYFHVSALESKVQS